MTSKININAIRILTVFLLSVSVVCAGGGGSTSSGGSSSSNQTSNTGIVAATNSGQLAQQIANDMNSGTGGVSVPNGYHAEVVAGNIAGQTYGVNVVANTSSNGGSNNNNTTTTGSSPKSAIGYFDTVDANLCKVAGWAYDPDNSTASIKVHVYKNAAAGQTGASFVVECAANILRTDVNSAKNITGNHGFSCVLPQSYVGSGNHALYIHAIDINGTPNNLLGTNGKTLDCPGSPSLTLTSDKTTYVIGQAVQLTWVPKYVSTCTASDAWTGAKATTNTNHTQSITPTAVGTYKYSLSCVGAGITVKKQVTVIVDPATDVMPTNISVTKACTQTSCNQAALKFTIKNSGADIASAVSVPYLVQYRVNGSNVWLSGPSSAWTGGIAKGAMTSDINVTVTGLTYSNYKVRILINNPKNNNLGETNFTDNISPEIDLSVAPNTATVDFQAADAVIRFNSSTLLKWTITSDFPTTCKVVGGGLNVTITHSPKKTTSSVATPLIKNKQNFSISCNAQNINGFQLPAVKKELNIEVVPNVQEI